VIDDTNASISKAINGDVEAFREIVERHQQFVYRAAFRLLANAEDARDATQECFIRVWKNLHTFDASKRFTTWLYKIIVNLCYDDLRRAYRKRKSSLEPNHLSLTGHDDIEEETINSDLAHKIRMVSKQLKPQQRMVFVLRDLEDLDLKEIAHILNISTGAVKSNLCYARRNIREKMQKLGYIS